MCEKYGKMVARRIADAVLGASETVVYICYQQAIHVSSVSRYPGSVQDLLSMSPAASSPGRHLAYTLRRICCSEVTRHQKPWPKTSSNAIVDRTRLSRELCKLCGD